VLIQVNLPSRFFGEAGLATLGFLLFEYIKVNGKGGQLSEKGVCTQHYECSRGMMSCRRWGDGVEG
jgi:hypothetical protein